MQILLIEPDKILANNISREFKKAGHSVDWQVDPQIALDEADATRPDAIILDLMLANRTGIEFLYEFRSYPEWQKLPIIIYSSLSAEELTGTLGSLEHLNISSYHYKPTTSLAKLVKAVEKSPQTTV